MKFSLGSDEKNSQNQLLGLIESHVSGALSYDKSSPIEICYRDKVFGVWTSQMKEKGQRPLFIDLESYYQFHKYKNYSLKKEPLSKALGLHKNKNLTILDATFGEGRDSMLILQFGAKVKAFERNPVLALLIKSYLESVEGSEFGDYLKERFDFQFGNPVDFNCPKDSVLYYDPMYSSVANKKGLPRKEMQIFREIVGRDEDCLEFLNWARANFNRVVVKRPVKADSLLPPDIEFKGKSTKYDVYLRAQTPQ